MVGLTENQVRGAIDTLLDRGLLERLSAKGEGGWQKDAAGKLIRNHKGQPLKKTILYRFSTTVTECFVAAAPPRRSLQKSKSPTAGPSVLNNRSRGFSRADQKPLLPEPTAPKGFPKPERRCTAPDSEQAAHLARLDALQQEPLPSLSAAALNTGRRTLYGRKPR